MPGWGDFPDAADNSDPWAGFPDSAPSATPPKPRKAKPRGLFRSGGPRVGTELENPIATDGDTVRAGDIRVRMLGIDAPELRQQGWDRRGNAVPLGQQSRDFLAQTLGQGPARLGNPEGYSSFGRTVAPIRVGQTDTGLSSLRYGQSFAAPDYLLDDPARRTEYLQAERLARQNGLGVHDYLTPTPAEFRDNPNWHPDSTTIAQFWDTPTPLQGLPREKETQLGQLYQTGTYDQIQDFLKTNGYETSRPEDLRAFLKDRDERRTRGEDINSSISYESPPPLMIDSGDGASGAFVRKLGSGFLASGLDELGAVADTLGGTAGRENIWNSDRRLVDIWLNNQRQNAGILSYDQTNYPYASTAGEITGGLASGLALPFGGGLRGARLAASGAAWGGAEGFLSSDGNTVDRLQGVGPGMVAGAIAAPALGALVEKGIPLAARGYRAAFGRGGDDAARLAGEAVDAYGEEQALDSALGAAQGQHDWSAFPDAPTAPSRSMAMEGLPAESLSSATLTPPPGAFARARPFLEPTSRAQLLASSANVQPRDVLPLANNLVDGVEEAAATQAGRYTPAAIPNERDALTRQTVRNWAGQEIPKVGPVDMVGWLRLNGGLRDQGGELRFMGITSNAARNGLDHVGQEARFGPMLSDNGMSLDDAAVQAWEAGYFPELSERPDVNTFLDALRDTYDGTAGRRFRPDDAPELYAYDNLQAERLDLEQRRNEGEAVFQDRSRPAEEGAPFPPVEAYAEWPSDAIERVGNIDVRKLDTPQDIRRALKTTHNTLGGFDAATRGRITNAEIERLASELNMTPEQLLSRRKGQAFNAEEALAARQILAKSGNELVNAAKRIQRMDDPGEEALAEFRKAWMRHVAIQEQVSGITAEAGRVLQQFKQAADARAVRTDVLGAMIRAGGGKSGLKDAANALLDVVEMGPGKFNALAEKAMKPKFKDKINELYINMLLSNPPTHVVNMVSNSLTAMLQIPEYAAGAAIGGIRNAAARGNVEDRILASEVGARSLGLLQGTKEGLRLFGKALRSGEADDFVSKVEGDEFKAISGLKGEVIRVPTRLLTAEDQLFKGIARRMELNAEAVRVAHKEGLKGEEAKRRIAELVANPTDAMFERALDYGRYLTFQRKLGDFGQAISRASGSNLPTKVVIPFVRTPINLLKFATERSVAAPLLKEWRADFMAGGERRDMAIAKVLLGSGLASVIYEAALEGNITGAVPPDPKKAKLLYADGWQPYSVKVGDKWVSYSRLDPLSTTLGVAADMATLPAGLSDRQQDDKATMLVASIMGNLASKTWLSGVSSFVEGLSDPGRKAEGWLQRTAGAFAVPAGVAGAARAIDPIARKRESVGDAIQARVPFLTDSLYPRRNVFGEPVELDSLGPDFLSPFWQSTQKNDPVVVEMLRIEKGVSDPGKQYTDEGERVDYTPQQYDRYHEIAGRLTYNSLLRLIGSPEYDRMSDNAKRKAASKAIAAARKSARSVLSDPDYPLPPRGGAVPAPVGASDPWSDFPDASQPQAANDPWADFADAPQRDVVGGLQKAIPGIGVTSGYRTREYQADMRRRGYKPANNSAHLDGSALDLTPPRGKSMNWLIERVRKVEPDAYLLPEGDHLHAVFPDWQGAPALGGAQSAGLVNPAGVR